MPEAREGETEARAEGGTGGCSTGRAEGVQGSLEMPVDGLPRSICMHKEAIGTTAVHSCAWRAQGPQRAALL